MKNNSSKMKSFLGEEGVTIRKSIFIPMSLLLLTTVMMGIIAPKTLYNIQDSLIGFSIDNFGWLFMFLANGILFICLWLLFSKHGDIRLGGSKAKPTMSTWSWITLSICSGAAAELFLWGTSQPLLFYVQGLVERGISPLSETAAVYAIGETGFMWTFIPYACYTICGLAIGFAVHNMKLPYKISSALYPVFGKKINGNLASAVDLVSFFAMVGSVAAVVGICSMSISSALDMYFGIKETTLIVAGLLTIVYVYTSYTGVDKGINMMADINAKLYLAILVFTFVVGPTTFILNLGTQSFGFFLDNFFEMAHYLSPIDGSDYPRWWTLFCWTGWIGFAPMSGLFLARLSKGRTIKECVLVNMIVPGIFSFIWFCIFGGAAINLEMQGTGIGNFMIANGMETVVFEFFKYFPLSNVIIIIFIMGIFVSTVTMANASTVTVAALCVRSNKNGADEEPPKMMKIFWGLVMALIAIVNLLSGQAGEISGIDATKQITTLTGFPVAFIMIFMIYSFIKMLMNREQYDLIEYPETAFIDPDVMVEYESDMENVG